MTVKELIEKLQQLDPDIHVFGVAYEGGVDDLDSIGEVQDIALNVNDPEEWWYGSHEYADTIKDKSKYTIVKGIIL
jgi:hypothetical protein